MNNEYEALRRDYLAICPGNNGEGCDGCPYALDCGGGACLLQDATPASEEAQEGTPASGLNAFAAAVHRVAVAHGWWEDSPHHSPPSFPEVIALCHSELSEALEAYRSGEDPQVINYTFEGCGDVTKDACAGCFGGNPKCGIAKPDGVPVELADCIIRILDYCASAGIDIEGAVARKHEHNKTRSYRHGGKRV